MMRKGKKLKNRRVKEIKKRGVVQKRPNEGKKRRDRSAAADLDGRR